MAHDRLTFVIERGINLVVQLQILSLVHHVQNSHIEAPVLEVIPQIPQIAQLVVHDVVGEGAPELV